MPFLVSFLSFIKNIRGFCFGEAMNKIVVSLIAHISKIAKVAATEARLSEIHSLPALPKFSDWDFSWQTPGKHLPYLYG